MSRILGAAMVAEGTDGTRKSRCRYSTESGTGPRVEFTLDWGSGEGAMRMARMAAQVRPELAQAYAGLGDEATLLGSTLMIRRGPDLVTLVMSDEVKDVPETARRIFEVAKARM